MKYLNGQLHNENDVTLCMRIFSPKQKMNLAEYLPMMVLCTILAILLLSGLFA